MNTENLPPVAEISRPRGSIRSRLLALALGAILVSIGVTTLVAYSLTRSVIRQAQQTSSSSLRAQAETYLVQINGTIAGQNNMVLDRAARDVQAVADAAAAIFNGSLPAGYWPIESHLIPGPAGQFLNGQEDISSVFIPNTQPASPELTRDVELSGYLDLILPAIMNNNPNAAAIYFGTEHDLTRYYPNIMLGQIVPADFKVTQRPWYLSSVEENIGRSKPVPVWSAVYQDATGRGLVTTIAMQVQDSSGKRIGVVGLDLTLGEISKNIETARFLKTGYSFLVDKSGSALVLPDEGYQAFLGRPPQESEFAPDLTQTSDAAFSGVIELMRSGESGFKTLQVEDSELFIAYSPLESTGWSLGSVVAAADVLQSVTALEQQLSQNTRSVLLGRVIPIGILMAIILLLITIFLTNKLVNPIEHLSQAAEQIGAGQRDIQIPVQQDDEIGFLARTLNQMAAQIRSSFEQLEERVAERTQQLEKRTLQLETAAEIASDITNASDLQSLLQRAVDLISARFDYYNVGIFLLDETGEYAHLRAASGDLGAKLVNRQIRLRVGQQGIVGYVTQFGQARNVGDVQQDETYQADPLLPESRSEAVIPLLTGGRITASAGPAGSAGPRAVIGALDVQSTEPDAFSTDDITVLGVLADQLAIAIQNIRLVGQLQATLDELSIFYQQQAKDAWKRFAPQTGGLAYEYDNVQVKPTAPFTTFPGQPATADRLIIPIQLREQVIGLIGLESDDPARIWTEDEIAVLRASAEEAALTVENARLLAESQRKATREQLSSEITARMRASLDVETVVRTAMNEIAKRMGIAQVEVQLGSAAPPASRPNPGRGDSQYD